SSCRSLVEPSTSVKKKVTVPVGKGLAIAREDRTLGAVDEEEIRASTVGEPPPIYPEIVVADYNPAWPEWFARAEEQIRAALGDRVLLLEHVGSTSVPDLPAKPLIDIDLVVADTTDEDAYVPSLEAAGYVLRVREPD